MPSRRDIVDGSAQWRRSVDRRSACFAVSADEPDELFRVVKREEKHKCRCGIRTVAVRRVAPLTL